MWYGWNQELGMISLNIRKMDHNKYYTNSNAKLNNFVYCIYIIQYIRYNNIVLVKKDVIMIKHDCANILSEMSIVRLCCNTTTMRSMTWGSL